MAGAHYRDAYKALLIANWTFSAENSLLPLRGPRHDIDCMYEALTHEDYGLFAPDNVLRCADLTRDEIFTKIQEFTRTTRREDFALIYYSGHGLRHAGKLYLAARDTNGPKPWTGVKMDDIGDQIDAKLKTDRSALILDCCYSGDPFGKGSVIDDIDLHGRWTLSSSSAEETSKDSDEDGLPSRFTHTLVEAMLNPRLQPPEGSDGLTLATIHEWMRTTLLTPVPEIKGAGSSLFVIAVRELPPEPTGFAPPTGLPELTRDDEVIDLPVRISEVEAVAAGHLAALLELVGRTDSPEDSGAVAGVRSAAWDYLTGTLRKLAVDDEWLTDFQPEYDHLTRLRLHHGPSDRIAVLPWEYMSIPEDVGQLPAGPLGLRPPLVIERSAARSRYQAPATEPVDRVALLGTHLADVPLAAEAKIREDLERLDVAVVPKTAGTRLWLGDLAALPPAPVLVVLAALRRNAGRVELWLHKGSRWVAEDQFVEQLRTRNYGRAAPHRVIVIEAFSVPPSLNPLWATSRLAASLASCGLGHIMFLCHGREFGGYTQGEPTRPATFVGNLVHALNSGATGARAFYTARRQMQQDFPDCDRSFGIPGLYELEFVERAGDGTPGRNAAHPVVRRPTEQQARPAGPAQDGLDRVPMPQRPPLSDTPRPDDDPLSYPPKPPEMPPGSPHVLGGPS